MRFPFFNKADETKKNPIGVGSAMLQPVQVSYDRKDKAVLAKEGYAENVVVYRAIKEIVNGASDIQVEIKENGEVLENSKNHPAVKLLNQPNPTQGYSQFIKDVFTDYLITGEIFIARYPLKSNKPPSELWAASPLAMTVVAGGQGIPSAYIAHKGDKNEKTFKVNPLTGDSDMFYMKMYNPLNKWRGLSPLEAAALAADTHNAGMKWNYSLLRNGARPSGIIKFSDDPSGETISRLKEFFKRQIQGFNNAGEIPILHGGAEWQATDSTPKDMDYIKTMKEMAKYIASAFGVPLPLIDNDSSSYNNMEQAKERLWTDTIVPMFDEFLAEFGKWLLPAYGENLEFCANLDSIQALEGVRERKFNRLRNSVKDGLLSIDEARIEMGWPARGGLADDLFINSSQVPISMSGFDVEGMTGDEKALIMRLKKHGYSDAEIKEIISE